MSTIKKIFKLIKEIISFLILTSTTIFKYAKLGLERVYDTFIEKLHFSLTFKITLVYARETLSMLMFLSLCIIVGFTGLSVWSAQGHMKRDFYMVSDYLSDGVETLEERIDRLAELDNLSITIFHRDSSVIYTTEGDNVDITFYGKQDSAKSLEINDNYILVKDAPSVSYDIKKAFKGGDYNFGYAMILREEIHLDDNYLQIQIKNRMPRENASLIILGLVLLGVNLFLLLTAIISGSKYSKKILKPIEVMTRTVENITVNELNTRLNVSGSQDELKDLARTFNRMLDRIQKFYDQQSQFVSDASHELRTPISVIQGYADLLHRWGKEDEKILDESLTAIKEESENMKYLVEKLLFLARGDKNTQKVEKKDFYLNELIDDIIKETKMIDDVHQIIKLKNEIILINADPRLIKESLRIFIDNSIKYTPEGGSIKIESILNRNKAQILIEDTGVGISKEDLPNIFNRFYRVDKSRTKGAEGVSGTGLGLAIAKWIIEKHNGEIKVESQINVGTKVIINIPVYRTEKI